MKNILSPFLIATFVLVAAVGIARAQDDPAPQDVGARPAVEDGPVNRPNLLRELGLSPEQVRRIRILNQERKPKMDAAARRLREANRSLDEAIYSDDVKEADFQVRLKEFQAAQAEIARLRFESELGVRMILSPEQLFRFREIRRRFAERRIGPRRQQDVPNERRMRRLGRPPGGDRPI